MLNEEELGELMSACTNYNEQIVLINWGTKDNNSNKCNNSITLENVSVFSNEESVMFQEICGNENSMSFAFNEIEDLYINIDNSLDGEQIIHIVFDYFGIQYAITNLM